MKAKTKLIATLMAMCLVITLGVFGILAVKTLNMSVGGNITFTADGISFEVSKGEFKTTSGSEYTGITAQTGKLQAFAMNTNTKLSDVQDKINSWAGLDLVATETLGDPVLHFSITNKMEDEILSFDPTITLGTNINDNMEILISPKVANIQANQTENFTITFHVKDTSINAGLTGENYSGFAINILLSTAVVAEPSEMPQMTFAPTQNGATTYKVSNCSTATGEVVIPSFVKVNNTNHPITEIADNAFEFNEDITSITIPNTVTRIGSSAFANCISLTGEIVIPESVTTIGDGAFYYCYNLSGKLVLPSNIKTIEDSAFALCGGFTGELVIPDSVTTIGDSAFFYCSGLTSVEIGNSVTKIGNYAFASSGICGELVIPNSVTVIGDYAFDSCGISSVVMGNSVTTICEGAFYYCSGIKSVVIGNSVTTIGERAFDGCSGLSGELVIPNSVTTIGKSAFSSCSKLTSITVNATTPPTLGGDNCFDGTNNCTIYVPNENYKTAEYWSEYASRMVVA